MYLSFVKNPFKMVRYPKMFRHFYFINFHKFSMSKLTKRNTYLERAKNSKKAVQRIFICNNEFNEMIKGKILSEEPFFCCRYGNSEVTACFFSELKNKGIIPQITNDLLQTAKTGPGVFPKSETVYLEFAQKYIESFRSADFNSYWGTVLMEEYLIDNHMSKSCVQYAMRALEPFQYEEPWTWALEGKKVLVIHPFADLIEQQYQKRNVLFDKKILPDMELITLKAIQSSGETVPEGYADWCEAFSYLEEKCQNIDFDVALLGCGSYAVPLASSIKRMGKKSIVLGGMMQLMFGIKGARWEESRPDIVAMYNEHWVRATGGYVVKDAKNMVDGPAYW